MDTGADHRLTRDVRARHVLIAAGVAQAAINLDFFAMQTALPRMAEDLDTTATDLQWVISGYMIALGACLIAGGRLGDLYGRRTGMIVGAALFGGASLGAGLGGDPSVVIGLRILQGVGAAILFPVSLAAVTNSFPPAQVQRAIGLVFGIAVAGTALGPLVGGILTDLLSWRWVFWINVPVVAVVIALTVRSVANSRDETAPPRIDMPGLVLAVASIAVFTFGIDRAADWGWGAASTLAMLAAGLAGLLGFVVVEARVRYPLLDLALFRIREFTVMIAAGTVGNVAGVVTIFVSMLFLQQVEGYDPIEAGVAFLAFSGGMAVSSQLSGRLERVPSWQVMSVALAVGGAGTIGMSFADALPTLVPLSGVSGLGLGMAWAYASVVTQSVVPPEKAGLASGVVLTILVGLGGVGVALAAALVETRTGASFDDALHTVLLGVGLLGLVMAPVVALLGRQRRRSLP